MPRWHHPWLALVLFTVDPIDPSFLSLSHPHIFTHHHIHTLLYLSSHHTIYTITLADDEVRGIQVRWLVRHGMALEGGPDVGVCGEYKGKPSCVSRRPYTQSEDATSPTPSPTIQSYLLYLLTFADNEDGRLDG